MSKLFNEAPLFLMLASLTGTLVYFRRQNLSNRFTLWTLGWLLMALHVCAQLITLPEGPVFNAVNGAHFATHAVVGMIFLLSFSEAVDDSRRRVRILLLTGGPLSLYAFLYACDVHSRWIYVLLMLWVYGFCLTILRLWRVRDFNRRISFIVGLLFCAAAIRLILSDVDWRHNGEYYGHHGGYYLTIAAIYIATSLVALRDRTRVTPGVLAVSGGFFLWGLGWLALAYFPQFEPVPQQAYAVWNMPKLMVAIGMILLELERQSDQARAAELRERQSSQQVLRYAELTSQLMTGVDLNGFCQQIADTISEVSDFEQCTILLGDSVGKTHLSAAANLAEDELKIVRARIGEASLEMLSHRIESGLLIGREAVLLHAEASANTGVGIHPSWRNAEYMALPMRSPQGNLVGCLFLGRIRAGRHPGARELAALEMLAGNMATALDKANIERQVLIQEKQASMGQMVGGVAHELNNPLTVLIGYCDLLLNDAAGDACRQEVGSMRREAQRMKTIIDNLLRFSRQSRTETSAASLKRAFDEVIELRSYDLKRDAIVLDLDIPDNLPVLRIDEAQLKTVLVQLLNNACEAVRARADRRVRVVAETMGRMLRLTVADSGPGFTDLDRAFDPFFSTKGVGRGVGLGLSVCYGIVKQCGGQIEARNHVFGEQGPNGGAVILHLHLSELDDSQHAIASVLVQ